MNYLNVLWFKRHVGSSEYREPLSTVNSKTVGISGHGCKTPRLPADDGPFYFIIILWHFCQRNSYVAAHALETHSFSSH